MIDYISFFEKQLERVNYWLSYAETKNAAMIALNVAMFFFPLIFNKQDYFLNKFCVYAPYIRNGEYYRLLTGTFLHANIIHLLCNMYALYILGSQLESFIGKIA